MSRASTRGLADRLAAEAPGSAKRAIDRVVGLVAAARTVRSFGRVPNPQEITLERQADGTYAPPSSILGTARARYKEEREQARRQVIDFQARTTGAIPDALEGDEDSDDDDEIPDAR